MPVTLARSLIDNATDPILHGIKTYTDVFTKCTPANTSFERSV